MTKSWTKLALIVLAALLVLSAAACTKAPGGKTKVKSMDGAKHIEAKDAKISAKVAKQVKKVKGIKKATVIVHGKDIVVGIDPKKRKNIKKLESSVHKAAKKAEPSYNVHVTSDKKLHGRIGTLHTRMKDGRPFGALGTDVRDLLYDIAHPMSTPRR